MSLSNSTAQFNGYFSYPGTSVGRLGIGASGRPLLRHHEHAGFGVLSLHGQYAINKAAKLTLGAE
jgi:hypothetical protein